MKFFSLINTDKQIHSTGETKVIPKEEFSTFLTAAELLEEIKQEHAEAEKQLAAHAEQIKQESQSLGFQEGLEKWSKQLAWLEEQLHHLRQEMTRSIVPLALTAVKKLIGRELSSHPETIVDIVMTALKPVSQHHKIKIYVNKGDLDLVEEARPRLKELFQHLELLTIGVRDDVPTGGCIIETEAGIINAKLENQMMALESAFTSFFQNKQKQGLE